MTAPPTILWQNNSYLQEIAAWRGLKTYHVGRLVGFEAYQDHSQLLSINAMFSNDPAYDPVDRTQTIKLPLRHHIGRPWKKPSEEITLSQALARRVKDIADIGQLVNLMWSGGIDSTCMVNAFVHCIDDIKQIRILYSPYSYYEHPQYLNFLQSRGVETVDISGDVYTGTVFDGVFVTGDGGDEMHASMDESFLEEFGYQVLTTPWKDFFWQRTQDQAFIDFCEAYFNRSKLDINTVLEARWWFYANSKLWSIKNNKYALFFHYPNLNHALLLSFFDSEHYESYITHNLHTIMPSEKYSSWKQCLKQYSSTVDGLHEINQNMVKTHSKQINLYAQKHMVMNNLRTIWLLSDGTRITTPSLPLLSQKEFDSIYGQTLEYLWNDADPI